MTDQTGGWDARVKLVGVLSAAFLAVLLERAWGLVGLLGVGALCLHRSGISRSVLRSVVGLLALAAWGTVLSQALFYAAWPRTVWVTLVPPLSMWGMDWDGLALYQEGISYGGLQALRFLPMLLLGVALCGSTSAEQLFAAMRALRLPYGLGFMGMTALRNVPILFEELLMVRRARTLRGYRPWSLGSLDTLGEELRIVRPVLVKAMRRASELSASLALRGFDPAEGGSQSGQPALSTSQRCWIGFFTIGVGMVGGLRLLFLLYVWEIWASPGLLPVYAWVRAWL